MRDFDLGEVQGSSSGLDAFFESDSSLVAATPQLPKVAKHRTRVASLQDLSGFVRTAEDQLVNKATQDLWSLRKDADGSFYIEKLFDDTGLPLKG